MVYFKRTMISFMVLWTVCLCLCCEPSALFADETKPQNATIQTVDLQTAINQAIAAARASGQKTILIPPGRYPVAPRNRQHLLLENIKDLTIEAQGVELLCTQTTRALTIYHCENLTIRGLSIDYEPLPFTQGRITAYPTDKKYFDVELIEGYPSLEPQTQIRYQIFAPDNRQLRTPDYYGSSLQVIDSRHGRITKTSSSAKDLERLGDIVVLNTQYAPDGSIPHCIMASNSTNLRLENITVYSANCFGFYETDCRASVYDHCKIMARPSGDDPAKRDIPRFRSTNADAFHSTAATVGPTLLGCVAHFMGDDCLNIHGVTHLVSQSQGTQLRVLAHRKINIQIGDTVEFVNYQGLRLPPAKVTNIQADGVVRDDEKTFLQAQKMDVNIKTNLLVNAWKIDLDHAVDLPMGSLIVSTQRVGNGFVVENCDFGFNRSRGILIAASSGRISNNTFTSVRMQSILIAPEYWWLEAGIADNILIKNNVIRDCGSPAISVSALSGAGEISPCGAHDSISILDNHITACPLPNILITSTKQLTVRGNQCEAPAARNLPDWFIANYKLTAEQFKPITTIQCDSALLENNGGY